MGYNPPKWYEKGLRVWFFFFFGKILKHEFDQLWYEKGTVVQNHQKRRKPKGQQSAMSWFCT